MEQRSVGRPALHRNGEPLDRLIHLKIDAERLAAVKRRAHQEEMTVSEWLRGVVDRELARQ